MPSVVPFVLGHTVTADDTDSSLLIRPSLLKVLEQAIHKQVCLLYAPAGSGKSVLMAQLYAQCQGRQAVAWLTLQPGARDPVRFFRNLNLALCHTLPDFDGFSSLQHHGRNVRELATLAMNVFVHSLQQLHRPMLIMIDNLDVLAGQSWLPVLQQTIKLSPPSVHWLLAGRNTQDMDSLQWAPDDAFTLITPEQLFFDLDESRSLLQRGRPSPPDEALVQSLFHYTKGWPAALKLAQIYLQSLPGEQQPPTHLFGRDIFSSLCNAVLDSLDNELRHFLIHVSMLESFAEAQCNHLLNILDSARHIERIKRMGLFIEPDPHQNTYRFHSLLQEHLQEKFAQQPQPVRDRLIARACLWLVEHQQRDAACRIARLHSQNSFFVELLRQSFHEWFRTGEADPVFYWAQELGDNTLLAIPELRFAWCWALTMFGELLSAEHAIQRTRSHGHEHQDDMTSLFRDTDTPQGSATAIIFAIIRLFQGEMNPILLGHLQRLYNTPSLPNSHRASIDNLMAQHAIQHCHFREARQRANQAVQIMARTGNRLGHSLGTYLIANAFYQNNDIRSAKTTCQDFLRNPAIRPGATVRALLEGFSAYLDYQSDQPLAAERQIHTLLLTYQPGYSVDLQLFLTLPLLHLKTRRREFLAAHFLLQQLEHSARASGSRQLQAHAVYERVRLAFASHHGRELVQLNDTLNILSNAERLLEDTAELVWEARERWIMAGILLLLQQGKLDQAQHWAQRLLYLNVDHGYPIRFLPINASVAYIEYQQGRISAAFRRLNEAFTQAEATGMLTGLLDDIPGMDEFVKQALAQQRVTAPHQVQRLQTLGVLDLAPTRETVLQQHLRTDQQQAIQVTSIHRSTTQDALGDMAFQWHQRNLRWYQDRITPELE